MVITRPRRFGKSFNLSVLHNFLAPEIDGRSTSSLFDNLKIAQLGSKYMQHQGKYPVIFVCFKVVKGATYDEASFAFRDVVYVMFAEHKYLQDSPKLDSDDKIYYNSILSRISDEWSLKKSMRRLSKYLYLHHGVKP